MATLWIREYSRVPVVEGSAFGALVKGSATLINVAQEPEEVDQPPVTFSTSTQSAAFGPNTRYVAIRADADFHYKVGSNPTATTNSFPVSANETLFIGVQPDHKVAAILAA